MKAKEHDVREKPVSFGKPLVNLKSGESFGDSLSGWSELVGLGMEVSEGVPKEDWAVVRRSLFTGWV